MICALCGKLLDGVDRKAHLDTDHNLDPNLIEWIVQFDDRLSKLEPPDATNRASTFYTDERIIDVSESLDHCSTCKNGYLKPTGEVVANSELVGEFEEIGSKRIYQCDNCKKRRIHMGLHEYINLTDDVKTELETK